MLRHTPNNVRCRIPMLGFMRAPQFLTCFMFTCHEYTLELNTTMHPRFTYHQFRFDHGAKGPTWASRPHNFRGGFEHLCPTHNAIFLEHQSSHELKIGDARAHPCANTRSHKVRTSVFRFLGSYELYVFCYAGIHST